MTTALRPVRHRPETLREETLRMELTALRQDVRTYCEFLEPRISALLPMSVELGPTAYQLVAGSARLVSSLKERAK